MSTALISVIVPAYNSASYIFETLESVRTQEYGNMEVLVIDDGSTDGQKELIDQFCKLDSRFHYYYQDNRGVSTARNLGFEKSTGEYVAFLDADDVWLPDNLLVKLQKFETGDFGLVHSDGAVINERSVLTGELLQGNEGELLNAMLAWQTTQVPGPSSILVKRDVLSRVGLFDEALSTSADQDFFIRIASLYAIGRVARVTWRYRIHSNNMHKNIARMEHDVLRVFNKARHQKMFSDKAFERSCFANMYLILAASWAIDGRNLWRGLKFSMRAIAIKPSSIGQLITKIKRKWG
jgi:glycosyltransferase involved in cell wall biosynthesis